MTKTEKAIVKEYFALFSYDKAGTGTAAICATEFFLFGSYVRKGDKPDPNPTNLLLGLAINAKGELLTEVPLGLAKVANYLQQGHKSDEAVKPEVGAAGSGCLECHKREKGTPSLRFRSRGSRSRNSFALGGDRAARHVTKKREAAASRSIVA